MRPGLAALVSIVLVALVTGVIFGLREVAPVLSLGVLYLFAVLPVAALWGLWFAVPVSIVSMLAFNFFFLEPRHTLQTGLGDVLDYFLKLQLALRLAQQ